METHIVRHVLIFGVAEVFRDASQVVFGLLHEQDKLGVVGSFLNALKVQRIVDLLLGLEDLVNGEVVMSLLQGVKGDVLVVLVELGCWLPLMLRLSSAHLGRYCLRRDGGFQVSPKCVVVFETCIAALRDLGLPVNWLHRS